MSFQTPITIADAIRNIESNRYLLPAIQREFEWSHTKIEWLFDSIMRNYPISSFLFWRVEGETKNNFRFYQFLKEYREKYNTHNHEFHSQQDFTAVLDGQQRLTSLYIGLRGSYAYRMPRLHEENSERVYPTRHLYLNIEHPLSNEEDGRIYEFKFLSNEDVRDKGNSWFKVSEIFSLSDDFEFNKYLDGHGLKAREFSYRSLSTLKNVIHSRPLINFFLEIEQNIDKALNVFIRINSGGQPLSFSTLLMSVAVANWEKKDARKEMNALVDNIRDKGFSISNDFVLKTFLYLHSKDIKFKVTNFSKENAKEFEREWDKIRNTILSIFDLVKTFGFIDATLTSKNALIPIIYYLYHGEKYDGFHTKIIYADDRGKIKKWLHAILVKGVLSGSSDNVLSQIRRAFTTDISKQKMEFQMSDFPSNKINNEIKRDVGVTDEFIDEILLTQKDEKHAFSILALLYPDMDYKNNNFHKDHLHPANKYNELTEADKSKYGWRTYNSILNLQMLDANENESKQDIALKLWIEQKTTEANMKSFLDSHLIPAVDWSLENFDEYIQRRKEILSTKLKKTLSITD
ncbi:MAG: DUF262 domain-containing protein [Gallionellaceae bacterium]|nr:MAG: DUF262 domain-containing protein [Gallionellaceae bacterium]